MQTRENFSGPEKIDHYPNVKLQEHQRMLPKVIFLMGVMGTMFELPFKITRIYLKPFDSVNGPATSIKT